MTLKKLFVGYVHFLSARQKIYFSLFSDLRRKTFIIPSTSSMSQIMEHAEEDEFGNQSRIIEGKWDFKLAVVSLIYPRNVLGKKNALFYSLCGLLKENLEFGNWCYSRFLNFNLDNIYLFKASGRNTKKRCEICSELTIKTPERGHWRSSGDLLLILNIFALLSGVFIIDFGKYGL